MDKTRLKKYLPDTNDKVSKNALLIEQANALESTRDILINRYNLFIPDSGSGSVKMKCPFSLEHKDGGVEKAMRYYFDTDSAFCFRDHGVIDPVFLVSSEMGVSYPAAAKIILEKHGKLRREHWSKRMREMLEQDKSREPASVANAVGALNIALRNVPGYLNNQYNPDVISLKQRQTEDFRADWDTDQINEWIVNSVKEMRGVVGDG